MSIETRHDRDLVWVAHATAVTDGAERRDANDARADTNGTSEDPLRELREYLARPIQAWQLDRRCAVLRSRIFGADHD